MDRVPADISERVGVGAAEERQLVARLTAGDAGALSEVYKQYGGIVFGVCRRVLRDTALAEDVTQEVFVSLWEHPERFDPSRGSLSAWMGMVARRRSIDRVRVEERRSRREERVEPARKVDDDPDEGVAASWLGGVIRDAIGRLPAEQRQAVMLAYFGGHTYRQVAIALDIPEGTVKSRLRLALAKLNTVLSSQLADQDTPAWT